MKLNVDVRSQYFGPTISTTNWTSDSPTRRADLLNGSAVGGVGGVSGNNCWGQDECKVESETGETLQILMGIMPEKLALALTHYLKEVEEKAEYVSVDWLWHTDMRTQRKQIGMSRDATRFEKIQLFTTSKDRFTIPKYSVLNSDYLTQVVFGCDSPRKKQFKVNLTTSQLKRVVRFLVNNKDKKSQYFSLDIGKDALSESNREFIESQTINALGALIGLSVQMRIRGLLRLCFCELGERIANGGLVEVLEKLPDLDDSILDEMKIE